MGTVRERTQSKRKPLRIMKIPIVLFVACVASIKAASFMDAMTCPPEANCAQCATTTVTTTTPAAASTTTPAQAWQQDGDTTTTTTSTTVAPNDPTTTTTVDPNAPTTTTTVGPNDPTTTTTVEPTTTTDICSVCTCDQGGDDSGAGSASMSLLALLLPAVFARLL